MNLLDTLVALIITILLFGVLLGVYQWGSNKNRQRIAAQQLEEVANAATLYAQKHQFELLPAITPTTGKDVTITNLIDSGFLPKGFENRNIWNQAYSIYFRKSETTVPDTAAGSGTKTESGIKTIVLTTGGDNNSQHFFNAVVPGIVGFLSQGGGFVPSGLIPSQPANSLVGAGWSASLAELGIPNPGPGHIGYISSYNVSQLGQDVLYRVAVPGMPELNAMQTELDMSDHAIKRIKEVQLVPHDMSDMENFCNEAASIEEQGRLFLSNEQGIYICRNNKVEIIADSGNSSLVKKTTVAVNNELIDKPTCAPDTNTSPQLFVAPAIAAPGEKAPPMTAFQTWVTNYSDTQWQVHIRVQTTDKTIATDGWVWPTDNYARILAMSMCVKNPDPAPAPDPGP